MARVACFLAVGFVVSGTHLTAYAEAPTRTEAEQALRKAVSFFHTHVARHDGYVWIYSPDLKWSQGEAVTGPSTVWVQPPGTPAVGEAILDAYEATAEPAFLQAARETADALIKGQLQSGGWHYRVEFAPEDRRKFAYREGVALQLGPAADRWEPPGGWTVWKRRKFEGNMTIVDDDTTPAALQFLMRVDRALNFEDQRLHAAIVYGLTSLRQAQYPIGAWSHNYDRFPHHSPDPEHYPVKRASYPESWSRTWTKDWTGCYMLNDRITMNAIATMLLAYEIYGEKQSLDSARRGGRFLLLAQMPDPQPAWAQEYNRHMQPVWDRKFEPPAITGLESQDALECLLLLTRRTGDKKYLDPVPKALAYLRKSTLPDGRLARFYELKTNRPLYFDRDYKLTYDGRNVPTHYGFTFPSRLDAIEAEYHALSKEQSGSPAALSKASEPSPELAATVRTIIDQLDSRGAWVEPGAARDNRGRKVPGGVITSATFIQNVTTLCQYLATTEP